MLLGVVGKSNVGKTTFFSAATLVDAEISNRIFTTIQPNKGVTFARAKCPCSELKVKCSPRNSKCINGIRYVPVGIIDVAGLVPDAHKGRGLGNQFLSDIMTAEVLILVIDASGGTDKDGNPIGLGEHDPKEDIEFFLQEIDYWILGILAKNWGQIKRKAQNEKFEELVYAQISGLNVKKEYVENAMEKTGLNPDSEEDDRLRFCSLLREKSKPMIIAANKMDLPGSMENIGKIDVAMPCAAEAEFALRKAAERGLISYEGGSDFTVKGELNERQKQALEKIRAILKGGSTGVQEVIDRAVFMNNIVVYPVENEHKFSDKKGNVLPDAFLVERGSTALNLAFKVHEDIGKKFISAVDARSGKRISADYVLKDGDVISIKAGH